MNWISYTPTHTASRRSTVHAAYDGCPGACRDDRTRRYVISARLHVAARDPKIYLARGNPTCFLACGCLCCMSKLTVDNGRMVCGPAFCRVHFEKMANILDATLQIRPTLGRRGDYLNLVPQWLVFGTVTLVENRRNNLYSIEV